MPRVTVRYWAAARAAAGCDSEQVEVESGPAGTAGAPAGPAAGSAGSTVGELLAQVSERHTGLAPVLRVATFLLDGRSVGLDAAVPDGATLEVLPPFAGG
ncbi:MAG TPA: MoaD/ThiS family protein [Dermatophilaceae bacterium]|nr:MoaD/ThiS family protein [Dermatophilaceae bacterium]